MGALDDLNNIFNPTRNGVAEALDPNKNGFNRVVGGFFKDSVAPFFKNTIGPLVRNMYDTFIVAPMNFIKSLYKAGANLLSGNGLTFLLLGIGGLVIIGGVVYYQTNKVKLK